jgi:hypothetical protein
VNHETLTKDTKRNTNEDKDLAALSVLHQNTDKNRGDLKRDTESVTSKVSIVSTNVRGTYSMRVACPGLNPPAT